MNSTQFDDFKQLLYTVIGDTEMRLNERIDNLGQRIDVLDHKVDQGFAGIAEIIEATNDRIDSLAVNLTS